MTVIAVIAAGAMGSNVGRKLVDAGNIVLTDLTGRSDTTVKRAHDAGIIHATWTDIFRKADIILSIIPPKDAFIFAEKVLAEFQGTGRVDKAPLVFVDCNAVNVDTTKKTAALFSTSPIVFLDACIIGSPPSGDYVPTFYGSADVLDQQGLTLFKNVIENSGIKVRILSGDGAGIGDASALKMSYAGISKGLTGLFTTMILAAHASSPATSDALLEELSDSQPMLLERLTRAVPAMFPKAYRWAGEMEEISGFVGGKEAEIYQGMSGIYERVERSLQEGNGDVVALKQFVEKAKSRQLH